MRSWASWLFRWKEFLVSSRWEMVREWNVNKPCGRPMVRIQRATANVTDSQSIDHIIERDFLCSSIRGWVPLLTQAQGFWCFVDRVLSLAKTTSLNVNRYTLSRVNCNWFLPGDLSTICSKVDETRWQITAEWYMINPFKTKSWDING